LITEAKNTSINELLPVSGNTGVNEQVMHEETK